MEEKEELAKLKERINCSEDSDCNYCPYAVREECLLDLYNKEKEKNRILEDLLQGKLYDLHLYDKELAGSYQANSISKDKIRELKEFYINDYKNRNITLIPLENLIKNINILLEE